MIIQEEDYGLYFENDFRHRWLRPAQLDQKLRKFRSHQDFGFKEIGKSVEGRAIEMISWGEGSTRILLWSQMHGNESTATMALVDLLNLLSDGGQSEKVTSKWKQALQIHIIPMLNPDGSEAFTRVNALGVDLNRDARRQAMPEMQCFMRILKELRPQWTFNLHDQRNIFSVGEPPQTATLSFLSPTATPDRRMTPVREQSMQLIAQIHKSLSAMVSGHYGRYTDEFYPRAIGDYLHEQNIPCILIESGAHSADPFRDVARKLNFFAFVEAFQSICDQGYRSFSAKDYTQIPENEKRMFDLLIRNCALVMGEKTFKADLGLLYRELPEGDLLKRQLLVSELGDLSQFAGIEEWEEARIEIENWPLILNEPLDAVVHRNESDAITFKKGTEV